MTASRRTSGLSIRVAISPRATYSAVEAPTCPLGKLDVGGVGSSRSTVGRARPTTWVAMTNTVAWRLIAMPGTTAYHHCFVRHQTRPMTMRHTAMTYSVLPIEDIRWVIEFQSPSRASWNSRLICFSSSESSNSGPLSR